MVEKTVLPCGLTVISEKFPEFPSFALSYTLKSGSRAETAADNGIHHLIEHMLFKGSQNYDLKQIADMADRLGGRLNAFTGKEITQYYIKSIDEKLAASFHLLSDIVLNSTFPEEEFLKEKNVIIQEIREAEDNPESNAFETFYEKIYEDNALGYPDRRQGKTVGPAGARPGFRFLPGDSMPRKTFCCRPPATSSTGNWSNWPAIFSAASRPGRRGISISPGPASSRGVFSRKTDSLNQCYVITALDSISLLSPFRHPFMIMNDILGSGHEFAPVSKHPRRKGPGLHGQLLRRLLSGMRRSRSSTP